MTNRNSKTHGLSDADAWRPKAKERKRENKAKARPASEARQKAIREALAKGNQ